MFFCVKMACEEKEGAVILGTLVRPPQSKHKRGRGTVRQGPHQDRHDFKGGLVPGTG